MTIHEVKRRLKSLELDPAFKFDPQWHSFTYKGKRLKSVTKFCSKYKKPFEKEQVSQMVAERDGITVAEVLRDWEEKGRIGRLVGSEFHRMVEEYTEGNAVDLSANETARDKYLAWLEWWNSFESTSQIIIIGVEIKVYVPELGIAGILDMLISYKDQLYVLDWKTNKAFSIENQWENLLGPFSTLTASDLNIASLQISTYRTLLQKIGINTAGGYVISIPEDLNVEHHYAVDLTENISKLLT